jgi:citrate lyase subunit beta/citryl-CoA lyase
VSCRSYLYVAGHDRQRIGKAYRTDADCVVLDLEDAVPESAKQEARRSVATVLSQTPPKPTQVRLSQEWDADIRAIHSSSISAVRIPKCVGSKQIREVSKLLDALGSGVRIVALIESARGVEHAMDIATADARLTGLTLGEADLRADMKITSDEGLLYARLRIVSVARAAGLPAPIQSVHTAVSDLQGLQVSCRWGRSVGFFGRSAVHPSQLAVINAAYTPNEHEVADAHQIIDVYQAALDNGSAAALMPDGTFVDPAVVESARTTIRLARKDHS